MGHTAALGESVTFYKPPTPAYWDDDENEEWYCKPVFYAASPSAAVTITKEMVDAACAAYESVSSLHFGDSDVGMRAALKAALAADRGNTVSTPQPHDCEEIRNGSIIVMARDADGNAVPPFLPKTTKVSNNK